MFLRLKAAEKITGQNRSDCSFQNPFKKVESKLTSYYRMKGDENTVQSTNDVDRIELLIQIL